MDGKCECIACKREPDVTRHTLENAKTVTDGYEPADRYNRTYVYNVAKFANRNK